jgi:nucleoside-diphosphate-sugar epimerase
MGDLAVESSLVFDGIDCVIHCAARAHVLREQVGDPLAAFRAVNRDATLALARAAANTGVRRFVFLSTIGVNGGETAGRAFRADDIPAPHSAYAIAKWDAELGLAEIAAKTGLETVILRPPLVLGPGAKGNLGRLLALMKRGLPLPFGSIVNNRRDLVSLDVLARLTDLLVDHPAAAGKTFLVSDGITRSTREIVEDLGRMNGVRAQLMPFPPMLMSAGLALLGRKALVAQLFGDLEVDIAYTTKTLGWHP